MKKILIVCLVVAALLIPITAFAATNDADVSANSNSAIDGQILKPKPMPKIDTSKLTDAQKKDLEDQHLKMIALKKETIDVMVANGTITSEQGDKMKANIDNREKIRKEKGIVPFSGMGKGGKSFGQGRKGRIRGCPNIGQQSPILTA